MEKKKLKLTTMNIRKQILQNHIDVDLSGKKGFKKGVDICSGVGFISFFKTFSQIKKCKGKKLI
jgi:hypothetical protein